MSDSEPPRDKEPWPWQAWVILLVTIEICLLGLIWPELFKIEYWQTVTTSADGVVQTVTLDRSALLRNLGLLVVSVVALALAGWRSSIANRQAEVATKQFQLAERGLETDRFQRGADMLQSSEMSMRIAGIIALSDVAQRLPDQYAKSVLVILSTFVSERSKKTQDENAKRGRYIIGEKPPEEILRALSEGRAVAKAASHLPKRERAFKITGAMFDGWYIPIGEFREADFRDCSFAGSRIFTPIFSRAYFHKCIFSDAKISGGVFQDTSIYYCDFRSAEFRTLFRDSRVTGCDFSHARFHSGQFNGCELEECDLTCTDFSGISEIENTVFEKCTYRENDAYRRMKKFQNPTGLPKELLAEVRRIR